MRTIQWIAIGGVWVLGVACGLLGANVMSSSGPRPEIPPTIVAKSPVIPPVAVVTPEAKPESKPEVKPETEIATPPADKPNVEVISNTLIARYRSKMIVTASSFWSSNWPPEKVIDGDPKTSWFTVAEDTAAHGKRPWVKLCFPEDVAVKRVNVLGNREPSWPTGYTVTAGKLELLDAKDNVLYSLEDDASGSLGDFEFLLTKPMKGVRSIRFTSLGDQGDQNGSSDIAIGEILVN